MRILEDDFPLIVRNELFPDREARPRRDHVPQALAIVELAADLAPLSWEQIAGLLAAVRPLGADLELLLARLLLPRALLPRPIAVATEPLQRAALEWGHALIAHFAAQSDTEALAWLGSIEALGAPLEPTETAIAGATHPHLARLNASRLEVRYRATTEPQLVEVRIKGSPSPNRDGSEHPGRVGNLVSLMNAGVAGGVLFAPELGEAEIVSGPRPGDPLEGADMAWQLRVRAIDPRFFAVALHLLAEAWATLARERDVRYCPKQVSIVGELPLDDSPASARTEDVLAWLKDPSDAYRAWPKLPFPVKEGKTSKSPRFSLRVDAPGAVAVALDAWTLPTMFDAHPRGGGENRVANTVVGKTQLTVPWQTLSLPPQVARGPILNMARRFHFRATKVSAVELALG
jgi:hypothetical protein